MEAVVARGIQIAIALCGAYAVALWFVLVVWTFRDIETRSRSVVTQVFSTLLVVLFYVPGVLLYMILRPKATLDQAYQHTLEEEYLLQDLEELPLCPSCERYVEDDFVLCPHCHTTLREACASCGRLVDLRWAICPYCGTAQTGKSAEEAEPVEAPAARWISPEARRRLRARPVPMPAPKPAASEPEPAPEVAATAPAAPAAEPVSAPAAATAAAERAPTVLAGGLVRSIERFRFRGLARTNGSEHRTANLTDSPLFRITSEPVEPAEGPSTGNGNGDHAEPDAAKPSRRFGAPKNHHDGANGNGQQDGVTTPDEDLVGVGRDD